MNVAEHPAVALKVFCRKRLLGMFDMFEASVSLQKVLRGYASEKRSWPGSPIPKCESIQEEFCRVAIETAGPSQSITRGREDRADRTPIEQRDRVERFCATSRFCPGLLPRWRKCL